MRLLAAISSTVGVAVLGVAAQSQAPAKSGVGLIPVSDIHSGSLGDGAESPNGRFVVLSGMDAGLLRFDRRTKQWAAANDVKLSQARWSPDGRFLAYTFNKPGTRDRFVWVVPMDTATGMPNGSPRRISMRSGGWATWSPDRLRR